MFSKIHFRLLLAFALLVFSTGCPVGIDYPLGNPGKEAIDKDLIGTWSNENEDPEVKKVKIKKGNDNSYEVEVLEKGTMYALETDILKGWITHLEGKDFVYFKPDNEDKYYLYCYEFKNGELHTWDVSLKVGGMDAVTSTEAFRDEVKASMEFEDFLSSEIIWTKD